MSWFSTTGSPEERHVNRTRTAIWLWIDQVAIPEVFEEMDAAQRLQTARLRIDTINNFNTIYYQADKVIIIGSSLLRLKILNLVDAAYVLTVTKLEARGVACKRLDGSPPQALKVCILLYDPCRPRLRE